MRWLLRPGGVLALLGLARSRWPADLAWDVAAMLVSGARKRSTPEWVSSAPTKLPPPYHYAEVRALVRSTLPDARYRRHVLWRYSVIWTKPEIGSGHTTHADASSGNA